MSPEPNLVRYDAVNLSASLRGEAREALGRTKKWQIDRSGGSAPPKPVVGGFVTRAGPLKEGADISEEDREALSRFQMQPTFVCVESDLLEAVVDGDISALRTESEAALSRERTRSSEESLQKDAAGSWVIRIDEDQAVLK